MSDGPRWIESAEKHPWTLGCRSCQQEAEAERDRYQRALEKIADEDYRGNRSTASQIAHAALMVTFKERDR